MRKVLSLATTFLVIMSILGCAARNNGGIGVRRLSEQNNISSTNANYRDGVYTGYGNSYANYNEVAVVEIRNGRIVDIDLVNANRQGGTNNIPGTGTNNQRETGTGMNNQVGINNGITYGNTSGSGNPAGTRNIIGAGPGTNNINGISRGTTGGTVGTSLNGVRTNLINAMIQNQRYDINVVNNDASLAGTINN